MLIETSIAARRDKTVRVKAPSGTVIVFANESGRLLAEVDNESDLTWLLALGDFFPADEADYTQAAAMIREDDPSDDPPDDEGDENAAPVEVATPPKAAKKRK